MKRDGERRGGYSHFTNCMVEYLLNFPGVMSNDAPTGSAAIGCLTHSRSVLK